MLSQRLPRKMGVQVASAETDDPAEFEAAIAERTRLLSVETIGNPRLAAPDLEALADC